MYCTAPCWQCILLCCDAVCAGGMEYPESRTISRMLPYATDGRCSPALAGELCRKAHRREPWLPVLPPFGSSTETRPNPCLRLALGGGAVLDSCLPGAHLLAGWHSLAAEALEPLFHAHPNLRVVHGQCFGHWNGDQGAARWAHSFGKPRQGVLLLQYCQEVLQWYPAFAGRYLKAWNDAYVPCKQRESEKLREAGKDVSSYYGSAMWRSCRPAALAAHDAATGDGGPAAELTPPYVRRPTRRTRSTAPAPPPRSPGPAQPPGGVPSSCGRRRCATSTVRTAVCCWCCATPSTVWRRATGPTRSTRRGARSWPGGR